MTLNMPSQIRSNKKSASMFLGDKWRSVHMAAQLAPVNPGGFTVEKRAFLMGSKRESSPEMRRGTCARKCKEP